MSNSLPSNPRIEFARMQRRESNEFSQTIWHMLRGRRMQGAKFRREHPVGPYTLDFVCLELRLNIEVDGNSHRTPEGKSHDAKRDAYMRSLGFEVLRIDGFRAVEETQCVRAEIEVVVKRLQSAISPNLSLSPPAPLPGVPGKREATPGK